jgi:carbon monoxide dehydrogenase subunit G
MIAGLLVSPLAPPVGSHENTGHRAATPSRIVAATAKQGRHTIGHPTGVGAVVQLRAMVGHDTAVLVERSFEVALPPAEAWAALADVARWPSWAPHIASVRVEPPGPVGAGTSGTFAFRPAGRSRFTMTAFDPPRSWTWTGRVMGVTIDYEHRFEPVAPAATRLVWVVRSRQRPGLRARAFGAIYARLIDRAWPRFVDWAPGSDGGA